MSERLGSDQDPQNSLRFQTAEIVAEKLTWLREAAEIIGGPGALVEQVFELPPQIRDEAPLPQWSQQQIEGVSEIASRFGYGALENVPSGLPSPLVILEGGKVWKIASEVAALEDEIEPRTFVFAGSPERNIGDDERLFLEEEFGGQFSLDTTEYDVANILAEDSASAYRNSPEILHFGYDINGANTLREPTGQLIHIGQASGGQSVLLIRVDQVNYGQDEETQKTRNLDSVSLMKFMTDVLDLQGYHDRPVVLGTSNAYASRVVDAVRAGLQTGREFGVSMYGRATIAAVRGIPVKEYSKLNQLPGDLRLTHDKLLVLQSELAQDADRTSDDQS